MVGVAVGASAILAALGLPGAGVAYASGIAWEQVGGPAPLSPELSNHIRSVACATSSNCMAVGFGNTSGSNNGGYNPDVVALAWNGSSWSQTIPSGTAGTLTGVACASAVDCWAVGYSLSGGLGQTLALAWNGSTWSEVATPDPGGSSPNELSGVACASAGDCWAVGTYYNGSAYQTLALAWNGSTWSQVATPDPGGSSANNGLTGVTCVSATDCWAVGYWHDSSNQRQTLALAWNGSTWSEVATPDPGGAGVRSYLTGVACASAGDCWAVGTYRSSAYNTPQTLALAWNGSTWSEAATPDPGGGAGASDQLFGVTCAASADCWAVGDVNGTQTLALAWNGSTWSEAATPDPGGVVSLLHSVTCTSAYGCWAVGKYTNSTTFIGSPEYYASLIVHYSLPALGGSSSPTTADPAWSVSDNQAGAKAVNYSYEAITSTSSTLTSVTASVPAGTGGTPTLVAAYNMPAGTVSLSGTTITYTFNAATVVPAKTDFTLEVGGIANTPTAGTYTSTVTTYDATTPVDQGATNTVTLSAENTAASVVVPESLTFTNNTPAFTLLPIPGAGAVSHTVSLGVETNAGAGYNLSAWATPISATSGSKTYTLAQGSTSGTSSLAVDTFAARASLAPSPLSGAALKGAYATTNNWTGYRIGSAAPSVIVAATGPTGNRADALILTDATSVDYTQPAGAYTGTITYVAAPNY